jgi:hypothetical protein
MNLCTYSKSEILENDILPSCPLNLKRAQAAKCPCRKREYHVTEYDLRVLSCTYPETFRGDAIDDPEAVKRNVAIATKTNQRERKLTMSTDVTTLDRTDEQADRQPDEPQAASEPITGGGTLAPLQPSATAATVYDRIADPLDFINKFGGAIYRSHMFGCGSIEQGQVLAMACYCERMNPIQLTRTYHIIGGNITMKSEAMLAQLRLRGGSHEILERSPERAGIRLVTGAGQARQTHDFWFAWEEAQKEPFVKDSRGGLKTNWATPRARMQMLWARVVSDGVRAMMPEINSGMYTPEEAGDFTGQTIDVTPEPAAQQRQQATIEAEFTRQMNGAAAPAPKAVDVDAIFDAATPAPPRPGEAPPDPAMQSQLAAAWKRSMAVDKPRASAPPRDASQTEAATELALSEAASAETSSVSPEDERRAMLREIRELKDRLGINPEQWKKVLSRYGVVSALALDAEQVDLLRSRLQTKVREREGRDELSQWADGALQPKSKNSRAGATPATT